MSEKRLSELKINEISTIKELKIDSYNIKTQLNKLGFIKGEKIKLLNYNYNKESYLVKVMNVNYAVDKKICEGIIVCDL